ncbi:hypothetical protein GDO78_016022, partial [Eleutherodactylus coqui]
KCKVQITHPVSYYELFGELATIQCPVSQYLSLDFSTVELVWTRNGSEIVYTAEEPRIQRKKDALWFFPAIKEDTGIYTCIVRNASYCVEISLSLNVMNDTPTSFPYLKYEQIALENTEFRMTCPALPDFTKDHMNMKINWFKDGQPLLNDSSKYRYFDETTYMLVNDVCHGDEAYYKCQLTFSLENTDYTISRIIQLRIIGITGSFLNRDGWCYVGETTEADGQYFELPLIFERIAEEDFSTDFKCVALNDYGQEVLPTQIKQA